MWAIEYSNEAKFYFLDNYPYTFELLVNIEQLKFYADATPPEGCTPLGGEPNTYQWTVLGHLVIYEKLPLSQPPRLLIWLVKPLK